MNSDILTVKIDVCIENFDTKRNSPRKVGIELSCIFVISLLSSYLVDHAVSDYY